MILLFHFEYIFALKAVVCPWAFVSRQYGKVEAFHDAYFHMERQERWQEEKQQEHGVMSYDALDNTETVGQENIADVGSPGLEENIIAEELRSRVRHAVAALPKAERELIQAIYYEGLSERVYAKQHGISQRGANKQRRKILSKLKMFLDFMGSF